VLGAGPVPVRKRLNRWNVRTWKKMLVKRSGITSQDELDTERITFLPGPPMALCGAALLAFGLVGD
jgi:hypothetical protein